MLALRRLWLVSVSSREFITKSCRPSPLPAHQLSLDVYVGGGEIDGRVTRGEWREHHLQVSTTIADDDLFCEHMKCVWEYGLKEKGSLEASHVGNDDLTGSTTNNGYNTAIRGPNGAHGNVEQADSNSFSRKNNGHGTLSQRDGEAGGNPPSAAREAWAPSPPTASNAERGPILHQGSARDATAARLSPGVLGLLARARGSLASGGMRAAFQLLKGFREEDQGGDGKVTLSGFKKAIGGAALGLGLKEAEMRIIFQVKNATISFRVEHYALSPAFDTTMKVRYVFFRSAVRYPWNPEAPASALLKKVMLLHLWQL